MGPVNAWGTPGAPIAAMDDSKDQDLRYMAPAVINEMQHGGHGPAGMGPPPKSNDPEHRRMDGRDGGFPPPVDRSRENYAWGNKNFNSSRGDAYERKWDERDWMEDEFGNGGVAGGGGGGAGAGAGRQHPPFANYPPPYQQQQQPPQHHHHSHHQQHQQPQQHHHQQQMPQQHHQGNHNRWNPDEHRGRGGGGYGRGGRRGRRGGGGGGGGGYNNY